MFREFIMLLLVSLFGQSNCPKHDLRKQAPRHKSNMMAKVNRFIQRNRTTIALIFIILCFILFVIVCFTVVGASGTESGNVYYHMKDVI